MFIWKDLDPDNFIIGMRDTRRPKGEYIAWGCVFVDGIEELFGKEVAETMKTAEPGNPVEFKVAMDKMP